ncbi:MAG: NAD-dependent epimerase/dehydratase family protein [Myxococcus sp.]|nr:NAD-dependent epimerase/dehydratase family protein [Myxococcus sp.]
MSQPTRPRVVIAGGTGALGRALAQRLAQACDVTCVGSRADAGPGLWRADLLSVAEAEVALAGAEVVVFLARTSGPRARLQQGSADDVDLLLADSVARAARLTKPRRLVFFGCGEQDEREAVLASAGAPLAVLSGGGDDPAAQLEQLVLAPDVETRRLPGWKGADVSPPAWSGPSTVLSVQRLSPRAGWTAGQTARAYFEWLPSAAPGTSTVLGAEAYEVKAGGVSVLRLRRVAGQSTDDLEVLEVRDGSLVSDSSVGAFEFRLLSSPTALMTTLRGFVPAMPWLLYRASQAPIHARIMRRFGAWLAAQ